MADPVRHMLISKDQRIMRWFCKLLSFKRRNFNWTQHWELVTCPNCLKFKDEILSDEVTNG